MFLPFAQQSEVNYDEFESGLITMKNSSYFLGLTYRKELFEKKWAFKFSIAAGEEHYNVQLYNEFINYEQNPEFIIDFKPYLDYFHQTYITSFEVEKRFNLSNEKYQVSLFGGVFINSSYQISYSIPFRNRLYPSIDGDEYYSYSEFYLYPPKKFGAGLSTGFSIRRFLYKSFYVEFLVQTLLRNKFEYRYDVSYEFHNLSDGSPLQTYSANNQGNRIDYSLIGVNLNLGIVW